MAHLRRTEKVTLPKPERLQCTTMYEVRKFVLYLTDEALLPGSECLWCTTLYEERKFLLYRDGCQSVVEIAQKVAWRTGTFRMGLGEKTDSLAISKLPSAVGERRRGLVIHVVLPAFLKRKQPSWQR